MEQNGLERLNERQRQLLNLVAEGTTTSKELAQRTGMKPASIDTVLQAASRILGAKDRREAAFFFRTLQDNSQQQSQLRISSLQNPTESEPSGVASTASIPVKAIVDFLRGPPLGGEEHSLRWDQIALQILRVAVSALLTVTALVLVVLGFFKTFG